MRQNGELQSPLQYDNLKITSMSPPSSGGICLAQIMNAIEPFDLHSYGHNSVKAMQVITEAETKSLRRSKLFFG